MSCDSDNKSRTDVINLASRFTQLDLIALPGCFFFSLFFFHSVCGHEQNEVDTRIKRSVGPLVSSTLSYQRQWVPGVETSALGTLDDTMHIFYQVGTYCSRRK
jgi:hypothetical protein